MTLGLKEMNKRNIIVKASTCTCESIHFICLINLINNVHVHVYICFIIILYFAKIHFAVCIQMYTVYADIFE